MASLPPVYTHIAPQETLVPLLTKLLPYSLPLLRRIQFHFHSPHATVLSTTDPSALPTVVKTNITPPAPDAASWQSTLPTISTPFAAIYVDRSRAPETECWLFSTADIPSPPATSKAEIEAQHREAYRHMLAILSHVRLLGQARGFPETSSSDPEAVKDDILMLGSLHENSMRLLKGLGTIDYDVRHEQIGLGQATDPGCKDRGNASEGGVIRGHTVLWLKYIYPPEITSSANASNGIAGSTSRQELPAGLEWSTASTDEDVELVIARSHIRRTPRTIRTWAGATIRETEGDFEGRLAAWAFIAADGSLASLHVEDRWRRKGMAKALTGRLKREVARLEVQLDAAEGDGCRTLAFERVGEQTWVHSDTGEDNVKAQGVLKGIGGTVGWKVYWAWVDLGRVGAETDRLL